MSPEYIRTYFGGYHMTDKITVLWLAESRHSLICTAVLCKEGAFAIFSVTWPLSNSIKARATKDLNYSWYVKVLWLSKCTHLTARAICREFLNISRKVNPTCVCPVNILNFFNNIVTGSPSSQMCLPVHKVVIWLCNSRNTTISNVQIVI